MAYALLAVNFLKALANNVFLCSADSQAVNESIRIGDVNHFSTKYGVLLSVNHSTTRLDRCGIIDVGKHAAATPRRVVVPSLCGRSVP